MTRGRRWRPWATPLRDAHDAGTSSRRWPRTSTSSCSARSTSEPPTSTSSTRTSTSGRCPSRRRTATPVAADACTAVWTSTRCRRCFRCTPTFRSCRSAIANVRRSVARAELAGHGLQRPRPQPVPRAPTRREAITSSSSAASAPRRARSSRSRSPAAPAGRSSSPPRSTPSTSSTTRRSSIRSSGTTSSSSARSTRRASLVPRRRGRHAVPERLARALRPGDDRVHGGGHAGDRAAARLGARGHRSTASPASSATTSTRWSTAVGGSTRSTPTSCRRQAARFSAEAMCAGYERVYLGLGARAASSAGARVG